MQIKIGDVNDNSPEFAEPLIRTNLKEDLPVGSSIVKVFAVDLDDPAKFGKIKFELSGDESFGIDAETGMIFLKKELDYEAVDFYKVKLRQKKIKIIIFDLEKITVRALNRCSLFLLSAYENTRCSTFSPKLTHFLA